MVSTYNMFSQPLDIVGAKLVATNLDEIIAQYKLTKPAIK